LTRSGNQKTLIRERDEGKKQEGKFKERKERGKGEKGGPERDLLNKQLFTQSFQLLTEGNLS